MRAPLLHPILALLLGAAPAAAGIEVAGRVVDADGVPLAEVPVEIHRVLADYERGRRDLAGAEPSEPADRAATDELGVFRLDAPGPGMWRAVVRPPGHPPLERALTPLLGPLGLEPARLGEEETLTVVVAGLDGRSVAGADVRVEPTWPFGRWRTAPHAVTDRHGIARFSRVDHGFLYVTAVAEGRAPAATRLDPGRDRRHRFVLGPPERRGLRVVHRDGRPAARILVTLAEGGHPLGLTGPDGRVEVAVARGSAARLELLTPEGRRTMVTLEAPAGEASRITRVELPPDRWLDGRVIERASRRPAAGAHVFSPTDPGAAVITGREGAYSLPIHDLERLYALRAAAAGMSTEKVDLARVPDAELRGPTIVLEPADASLVGAVEDPDGLPVAGVTLSVLHGVPDRHVYPDGAGRFSVAGLPSGRGLFLHADLPPPLRRATRLLPTRVLVNDLGPGEERRKSLVMERGHVVVGRVVDEIGNPIAGAEASVRTETAWSDAEGRFRLEPVASSFERVEVRAPGFASVEVDLQVGGPDAPPVHDLGEVALEPGVGLAGWVLDAHGLALPGAAIWVKAPAGAHRLSVSSQGRPDTVTDAEGAFFVADRRRGEEVRLEVRHRDHPPGGLGGLVLPLDEPAVVNLPPGGEIEGRVVDGAGEPVADAFVLLAEDGAFGSPSRHRIADADGRFRLDSLPAGRYSLTVEAGGYRTVEVGPLEVAPGLPLHELVVLDRGAVVFGTVVDADGEPVADASVREVPDQPAVSLATVPGQTGTDGDGRYRMEGLPTGRIAIAAEAPGHHRAVREIEAAPGPNRLDLTLERRPVYEVSGRVLDAAGASVAGARVSASGAASQGMGFHADGESGDDGSFSLGEVPDGAFRLHVHHEAFVPYEETIRVAGEPVFRDVRLVSGGAIEGQVLGLGGRHASASVEGRWLGGSGGEGDRVTGVDPRYRLEGLQAGRWQVEAAGPEGRSRPHAVRVGAGETVYLDLELEEEESLELAGQAFRNGLPLAGGRVFSTDPGGGPGASEPIDRLGHFRLTGLRAGTHRLSFLGPEGDLEHRLEVALESGREVVVEWWVATVTGRAVDGEEGTPVAGAEVRLLAEPWGSGGRSRALRTGEDGGFAFDRVGEGSWRVGVEKEGYARRELAIERRGAEPVDGLEVELEPTSGLTLLVRLPTGPPPRSVSATGWDGEGRQALSRTVDTGEGGRVRLPSVGSLPLTLRVTSGAFFGEIPGATAGSGPIAVDLRLGGDLHLVVPELVAEGSTATVTLRDPSGRSAPWVPTTVRGGRLSARTLRPGRWTYRIEAADGRRWTGEVAVAAGAEVAATVE